MWSRDFVRAILGIPLNLLLLSHPRRSVEVDLCRRRYVVTLVGNFSFDCQQGITTTTGRWTCTEQLVRSVSVLKIPRGNATLQSILCACLPFQWSTCV